MLRTLAALALAASLAAAEPATGPRPSFGWTVPDAPPAAGAAPGIPVLEVRPGGTAATLGVVPGDRITAINGTPTASSESIRAFLAGAQAGMPVSVELIRDGAALTVSGVMQERAKPTSLAQELAAAKAELARLRAQVADKSKEPSLVEILQSLQDLDRRLPKAAAAFRKQYPNGDFDIRISVTITSDRTAKDAIEITNLPAAAATQALPPRP